MLAAASIYALVDKLENTGCKAPNYLAANYSMSHCSFCPSIANYPTLLPPPWLWLPNYRLLVKYTPQPLSPGAVNYGKVSVTRGTFISGAKISTFVDIFGIFDKVEKVLDKYFTLFSIEEGF